MTTIVAIRDTAITAGGEYSPAKEKAANRGVYNGRSPLLHRRIKQFIGGLKFKLLFFIALFSIFFWFSSHIGYFMGWNSPPDSPLLSPSRVGYTVLINTWKRNSLLKQSVEHYASCSGTDAIHVVWSESEPPSEKLRAYLERVVSKNSKTAVHKPNLRFDLNKEDNLNNRFKPIQGLRTDAIFSIDDDVIVPCRTLEFAFTVWQSAPLTMVGFVPRMHWLDKKNGMPYYKYGGWWSVWWTGTYSMVLSKAAFFHRMYLDHYTYKMPSSIHDYITKERNCEDIAMSLLVANTSDTPPIWVKGKMYEIGSSGISSIKGHSDKRNKCLNDFVSLYGSMPLVATKVKGVDATFDRFW